MTDAEQQADELEAIKSIFEGDEQFSVKSDTSVQYKYGEPGSSKSFLLEVSWPPDYPSTSNAVCNLDLFYNKHLLSATRSTIQDSLNAEMETLTGMPMTYSLVEFAREHVDEWMADQPDVKTLQDADAGDREDRTSCEPQQVIKETKERLTKGQKRRMWDRGEGRGERERGWNWVDIIKHLSQTGKQDG